MYVPSIFRKGQAALNDCEYIMPKVNYCSIGFAVRRNTLW